MTVRRAIPLLTLVAVLAAPSAGLASGRDVLDDCLDDEVMTKTFTQKEYREALRILSSDADQYGNCRDVIRRAQQAALAAARDKPPGGAANDRADPAGPGGPGAVGKPPAADQLRDATAAEREAVQTARRGGVRPPRIGDATVDTTKVGRAPGIGQVSDLPLPVLVLLALLLAGALALGGLRIRALVGARRAWGSDGSPR